MKYFNAHIKFDKEKGKSNSRKDDTPVTCVRCKKKFVLPFRPRKPEILCDECFKQKKAGVQTDNKKKSYLKAPKP